MILYLKSCNCSAVQRQQKTVQNIWARYRRGRLKKPSAREDRRLKMLLRLGRLKTTSGLFFHWRAFVGTPAAITTCEVTATYNAGGSIFSLVLKKYMFQSRTDIIASGGPTQFSTGPTMAMVLCSAL